MIPLKNELIILKFGTTSVCNTETLAIREDWIQTVAEDVKQLIEEGNQVVIFTSGGLATGRKNFKRHDNKSSLLQNKNLLGALGLSELLFKWQQNFELVGLQAAGLTIREEDVATTAIIDLIQEMLVHGIIPVINENIPLQTGFNNDELAATVCKAIKATKFILFTDTDGVFTDNPKTNPNAEHLDLLNINELNIKFNKNSLCLGTGGMEAKLIAASKIKKIGIDTIITNGVDLHPILNLNHQQKYTLLENDEL